VSAGAGGPEPRASPPGQHDHDRGVTERPAAVNPGSGSSHSATAVSTKPTQAASRAGTRWAKLRAFAMSTWERFTRDRCSTSAWSLASKGFLAIFPALIALLGLVHLLDLSGTAVHKLTAALDKILPPGASAVVSQAVSSASHEPATESEIALISGILVALWSVAGGISTLQIALDIAYEVPHDRRYIARHLRSLPLMLATLILGLGASALSVFGASLGHAIRDQMPFGGTAFTIIWTVARWLITVAAITVLLQLFYSYGPNRKGPGWRWASLGSALGAAIFLLASLGFSFYVKHFGSYEKVYGALAGAVILILWLYLGGIAVLVGAELNAEIERRAASGRRQVEHRQGDLTSPLQAGLAWARFELVGRLGLEPRTGGL
jgi:membrane protein